MKKNKIVIGTRSSLLALWQTEHVASQIKKLYPDIEIQTKKIKTTGDKILDVALAKIGDKGLFVKEIEEALLKNEIDLAVHSMKDVPTKLPDGLLLAAILKREDARDVFISSASKNLESLPKGAVIGTSSLRRISQLLFLRPDLKMKDLRGNVQTRLRKMEELGLAGTILAAAGVKRLGFENRITEYIPFDLLLPAVGQGSIGIEIRKEDKDLIEITDKLNHKESYIAILSERAFLRRLEGGCQVPMGALGTIKNEKLILEAFIASLDGKILYRDKIEGKIGEAESIGIKLAEILLSRGGDKILKEIYRK